MGVDGKPRENALDVSKTAFILENPACTIFDQTPKSLLLPTPSLLQKRSPLPAPDHAPPFTGTAALCPSSTDGGSILAHRRLCSQIRVESEAAAVLPPAAHRRTLPGCEAGSSHGAPPPKPLTHTPLILRNQTKPNLSYTQTHEDQKDPKL